MSTKLTPEQRTLEIACLLAGGHKLERSKETLHPWNFCFKCVYCGGKETPLRGSAVQMGLLPCRTRLIYADAWVPPYER